jgi:hypothetical protein
LEVPVLPADGWPNYPRRIAKVELLGSHAPLRWKRTAAGLEVHLPHTPPCQYAYSLRILPG